MSEHQAAPLGGAPISRTEFIALMAMLAGTIAFSIDAMLPALPDIAAATGAIDNREQFIITAFVLGTGLGTFVTGPISDAVGRQKVAIAGSVIYSIAALVAAVSNSLEVILAARVVQGFGAAGPRVAVLSIIRDLYSGRQMAKIVSFVMIVFALVPTIAPSLGAAMLLVFDWHAIFVSFAIFSIISVVWMLMRLPETLPPEKRRPLRWDTLKSGTREVMTNRTVILSIVAQSLAFGTLFGALSASQSMFDQAFDRAESFPLWFGGIAAVSATGGFLNASIVERLGMRSVVGWAFAGLSALSIFFVVLFVAGVLSGPLAFPLFILFQTVVFFNAGLTIGNLNALALEPVGHIAGLAASLVTASATIFGALLAAPVTLLFDATMLPLVGPIGLMAILGTLTVRAIPTVRD